MKRLVCLVWIGMSTFVFGQQAPVSDSLLTPLLPVNKQSLLKDFDVNFYMRYGLDSYFKEEEFTESRFNGNDLRIELKAKVHDRVKFRFRNRLTSKSTPGTLDNVRSSVDLAFVDIQATPKVNVALGRIAADWGGYEYDLNAIEVLAYNDILSKSENYMVGLGVAYQANDRNRFNVQVMNASANKLSPKEGFASPAGVEDTKTPYAVVGNWRGSFFKNRFQTSYSYSYFTQAKNKGMHYIALGNKYQNDRFTWMYDFQYVHDAIDNHTIMSSLFPGDEPVLAEKTSYIDHWTRVDYKLSTALFLSVTLMTSNGYVQNASAPDSGNNHLRTSYGVIPMVQYRPFKKLDLRFFAAYVGRWYSYSRYAKESLNQQNYNTGRISVGIITPLKLL